MTIGVRPSYLQPNESVQADAVSRCHEPMTKREILIVPDARLKRRAAPVACVDAGVRALMAEMLAAMHAANGIGLAAPQLGVQARVIVADVAPPDQPSAPVCMANPVVLWRSAELITGEEGCLSLPEQYADVTRPAAVRIGYRDAENVARELAADGLLAKCLQHEIDHLDGILFIDHISALKRNIILRKLAKARKQATVAV